VDARGLGVDQRPDPGGGGVAEDGVRPGMEKCCKEAPLERDRRVANGENPAMKAVEPASSEPAGDHGVAQTQFPELSPADDALLPDDQGVKAFCVDLCPTVGHDSTQKGQGVDARR